ncbi:MAG TPA: hypothetical protein PKK10_14865 [Woeseiaceae bacterium]|nr:hypothetical protein [Woeseiaceae bacterium]
MNLLMISADNKSKQSGAVLVTSLIFLLIVIVITTSMFRDVGLQEMMSGNHRSKVRTQHTANSALRESWVNLLNLSGGEQATDARTRTYHGIYDQDLDGDALTQEVDMTVDVNICFDGTTIAPGTDTDFAAYKFDIQSTAVDQSGAITQLLQGGYIIAPAPPTSLATTCP